MIKQWRNENLGVNYFYLPNSKNNEILTSDGVLVPYEEFKSMTSETYNMRKNTNGGYDYILSKQSERLVKKAVGNPTRKVKKVKAQIEDLDSFGFDERKETPTQETTERNVVEEKMEREDLFDELFSEPKAEEEFNEEPSIKFEDETEEDMEVSDESEEPILETSVPKPQSIEPKETRTVEIEEKIVEPKAEILKEENIECKPSIMEEKVGEEDSEIQEERIPRAKPIVHRERRKRKFPKEKKRFNLFDFAYPKIMLSLAITCSVLSIYFTGVYLQRLQIPLIAYSISTAMLLFGIIGFQVGRMAKKSGHKKRAFIYFLTSVLTIGFSMMSSLDVNYSKYQANHSEVEKSYNSDDGMRANKEFIEKRIEENKEEINRLREDAEFQKTQFTILWDNELKKNVVVEGRLSATAQTKISEDNSKIEELMRENKDLGDKLMEYSESGVSMTNEGTKEKSKTLTDLLGSTFRVSGNLIQLIILLIPSFFLDTINLLATMAYIDSFEKEKEEE